MVSRRFSEELNAFVGKSVNVVTSEGKEYAGLLLAVDESLNIILDRVSGAGPNVFKMVVNGGTVKELRLAEKPFDYKALGERLNRVFPGFVVVREDVGAILVMEKIKVTEKGVEGTGIATEKVRAVFDEYVRESKR